MDSLSDKLKAMGVRIGARDLPPRPRPTPVFGIDRVVPGHLASTAFGEAYLVEGHYPREYRHGNAPLAVGSPLSRLFEWSRTSGLHDDDLSHFYFLDIETTGLSGGTGTYPFMVGVGHFGEQEFELTQFFMRDPSEEPALLAALMAHLNPCHAIVTFNGKSFDAPILNTRFILQGLSSPLHAYQHIDLLPLARRLWRDRLPSRALGYLETSILGAVRTQAEVPGWLIPQLYFDYLRSGDARPLAGVFYHNAMDILALAALFSTTARMLMAPLEEEIEENVDRLAIARLYEELGHPDEAVRIYQRALEGGLPEEFFWNGVLHLALLHKRMGNWTEAALLWRKAAGHGDISAHIELAKHHEHLLREPAEALAWTLAAIECVNRPGFPPYERRAILAELLHRRSRLERKIRDAVDLEDNRGVEE